MLMWCHLLSLVCQILSISNNSQFDHPTKKFMNNSFENKMQQKKPLSGGGLFEDKKAAGS
jgi:hypothetical protein